MMYVRRMSTHTDDQRLLIHFFQDSLAGAVLKWYMSLDNVNIHTFNDLGEAFIRQYKYNLDMAPNCMQFQNLSQKKDESFKEYAQRWREMEARVKSPLLEKGLVDMFMGTLQGLYYDKMVGSVSSGFSDLVTIGERIEAGIKSGKIQGESYITPYNPKRHVPNFSNKKEGEINVVASHPRTQKPLVILREQQ